MVTTRSKADGPRKVDYVNKYNDMFTDSDTESSRAGSVAHDPNAEANDNGANVKGEEGDATPSLNQQPQNLKQERQPSPAQPFGFSDKPFGSYEGLSLGLGGAPVQSTTQQQQVQQVQQGTASALPGAIYGNGLQFNQVPAIPANIQHGNYQFAGSQSFSSPAFPQGLVFPAAGASVQAGPTAHQSRRIPDLASPNNQGLANQQSQFMSIQGQQSYNFSPSAAASALSTNNAETFKKPSRIPFPLVQSSSSQPFQPDCWAPMLNGLVLPSNTANPNSHLSAAQKQMQTLTQMQGSTQPNTPTNTRQPRQGHGLDSSNSNTVRSALWPQTPEDSPLQRLAQKQAPKMNTQCDQGHGGNSSGNSSSYGNGNNNMTGYHVPQQPQVNTTTAGYLVPQSSAPGRRPLTISEVDFWGVPPQSPSPPPLPSQQEPQPQQDQPNGSPYVSFGDATLQMGLIYKRSPHLVNHAEDSKVAFQQFIDTSQLSEGGGSSLLSSYGQSQGQSYGQNQFLDLPASFTMHHGLDLPDNVTPSYRGRREGSGSAPLASLDASDSPSFGSFGNNSSNNAGRPPTPLDGLLSLSPTPNGFRRSTASIFRPDTLSEIKLLLQAPGRDALPRYKEMVMQVYLAYEIDKANWTPDSNTNANGNANANANADANTAVPRIPYMIERRWLVDINATRPRDQKCIRMLGQWHDIAPNGPGWYGPRGRKLGTLRHPGYDMMRLFQEYKSQQQGAQSPYQTALYQQAQQQLSRKEPMERMGKWLD